MILIILEQTLGTFYGFVVVKEAHGVSNKIFGLLVFIFFLYFRRISGFLGARHINPDNFAIVMRNQSTIVNEKELTVIRCLRKNARMSLVDISAKAGMSVSNTFSIVRKLKQDTLSRTFCELNYSSIGYNIHICFIVRTKDREKLVSLLERDPFVNDMLRINNGNDYYIEAIFKNMSEVYLFAELLAENSVEVREHHIVKVLAKEKMLQL